MDWQKLREHKCPQCGVLLTSGMLELYIYCECGFTISHARYEEIMISITRKRGPVKAEDNLSELNNL